MTESVRLPVLPLDDEVVLPGMVVPLDLSDSEVRAAVDAARAAADAARNAGPGIRSTSGSAELLLVPRTDGHYGAIGTRADLEQLGRLPNGHRGAVIRGTGRMAIGTGTTGPGAALWVEATPVADDRGADARARELATELKHLLVGTLHERGMWQIAEVVEGIDEPGRVADQVGYASYLTRAQKQQLLETLDVKDRLELVLGWVKEHIAEQEVAETIRKEVSDGVDKQQREF